MSWHRNEGTWHRDGKKSEKQRRPCSGSTSRSLVRVRVEKKNVCVGPAPFLCATSAVCGKVFIHNTASTLQQDKKNIYLPSRRSAEEKIITVPPRRRRMKLPSRPECGKLYTVPSRRGEQYLPSRPAEGKNIYRPVPPRTKPITVPSRPRKKQIPSRPVVKICPVELYRPAIFFLCLRFTVPLTFVFPPNKYVPSRPAIIHSHCDKRWKYHI